jgi:hypothetical protein
MSMYDALFAQSSVLNEQIARQLFETMPESGITLVIMDKNGNCWPSNSEQFSKLHINESVLREICSKINDGQEPVISNSNDCSIIGSTLATDKTDCGYIFLIIPQLTPENTVVNIDLFEIIMNQVTLVAKLIEKNNMLYELQIRQSSLMQCAQPNLN